MQRKQLVITHAQQHRPRATHVAHIGATLLCVARARAQRKRRAAMCETSVRALSRTARQNSLLVCRENSHRGIAEQFACLAMKQSQDITEQFACLTTKQSQNKAKVKTGSACFAKQHFPCFSCSKGDLSECFCLELSDNRGAPVGRKDADEST